MIIQAGQIEGYCVNKNLKSAMKIMTVFIIIAASFVDAKRTYKYPQQANPRIHQRADYPARIPRNHNPVGLAKPIQTITDSIKPTAAPEVIPEDSWDATITEWIRVVDPAQIRTETVTTTVIMAKLNVADSATYAESYIETNDQPTFDTDTEYDYNY
jgi:hypothetical protein